MTKTDTKNVTRKSRRKRERHKKSVSSEEDRPRTATLKRPFILDESLKDKASRQPNSKAWSSLVEGYQGCICPSVFHKSKQNNQHVHGTLPCTFGSWATPVVHLLLLKSSMAKPTKILSYDSLVLSTLIG